jgi:multidrug resistance efflux pump
VIFIIVLPYLGIFVYLIARGGSMHERAVEQAQQTDQELRQYVQQVAGSTPSVADELERLASLHDRGKITDEEFATLKAKAMAGASS